MQDSVRVLLADPPWRHADRLPGPSRGAAKNYHVLSTPEVMRFDLPALDDVSCLFLWRLASMPRDAIDVANAWGFTPKSEIVWQKLTKTGKPWFGMGRYVRASHETCIIATRGRFKVASRSIRSTFAAKVPVDAAGNYIHSAKPEEFYAIVEQLTGGGPYCELFARRRRPGWISVGNQLPGPETYQPTT